MRGKLFLLLFVSLFLVLSLGLVSAKGGWDHEDDDDHDWDNNGKPHGYDHDHDDHDWDHHDDDWRDRYDSDDRRYSYSYSRNYGYNNDHKVVYRRVVLNDYYTRVDYSPYYYGLRRGPEIYYTSYNRVPNYKFLYSPKYMPYGKPGINSYYNSNCYDCYPKVRSVKYYTPYENRKYVYW
jgi:hypothetical protein